ncbi:MAG: DNA cytosine methyltransferase, partial [bacterium]
MPVTFGSLFAGIGGLDLGFERAGMVCKWQVEVDEYAQRVLAKHWPTVRRWDDVRTWPQPDTEYVDCIVGGFPCQDISYAGKGAGLQGERSGLFFEVCRIVREMGPRFIVLENVAALLTRGLGDVLVSLASLGYAAEWHCI